MGRYCLPPIRFLLCCRGISDAVRRIEHGTRQRFVVTDAWFSGSSRTLIESGLNRMTAQSKVMIFQ